MNSVPLVQPLHDLIASRPDESGSPEAVAACEHLMKAMGTVTRCPRPFRKAFAKTLQRLAFRLEAWPE